MKITSVANGMMRLDSEDAVYLFEALQEEGSFWEYVSVIFNKSLSEKQENVKEAQDLSKLMKMIEEVQQSVLDVKTKVNSGTVVTSTVIPEAPTIVNEVVPPKPRERKKTKPIKLDGNAGFGAMANAMKQFK